MAFKKSCHETWCSVKATFFSFPRFFETHDFELKVLQCIKIRTKTFTTLPICNKKHFKQDFEIEFLRCVTLGIQKISKSQIFCLAFLKASKFKLKPLKCFRFRYRKFKTNQNLKKKFAFKKKHFWFTLLHESGLPLLLVPLRKTRY